MFGWYEERKALSGILLWSLNPATSGSVYGLSACVSCDVMTAEWLRRLHWEDIDPPPPNRSSAGRWPHLSQKKKRDTNLAGFSAVQLFVVCCCCLFSCFFLSVFVLTGSFWRPSVLRGRASKGGFNPWPPTDQKDKTKKTPSSSETQPPRTRLVEVTCWEKSGRS